MSQPPPPPSQPPTGGPGAPQDPPPGPPGGTPGGYGYPQQPGQPAGYGYPQQPPPPPGGGFGAPTPPPPGGGFGAPTPPPPPPPEGFGAPTPPPPPASPYGQPGQPGQPSVHNQPTQFAQPVYGQDPGMYPTAPPGAMPGVGGPNAAPGGGSGSGGKNKMVVIVASVVAVALIAAGSIFFLTKGDDGGKEEETKGDTKGSSEGADGGSGGNGGDGGTGSTTGKPKSTKGEMLFSMDVPKVNDLTSVAGLWATEDTFAKSTVNAVLGVDPNSGKEKWKIKLDGAVCAASRHMSEDNKSAVVTRETKSSDAPCNQMAVIDIAKGKKVWQETMPEADTSGVENVTISQGTVASAWIGGSVGYDLEKGGKPLWSAQPGDCRDQGYAGGEKLVAVVECGSFSDSEFKVQTLNPKDGKKQVEFEVPKGVETVSVASTDPLVLVVGAGEVSATDIMTVSPEGKLMAKVPIGERYEVDCDIETEACKDITVGKDAFYLPTAGHEDGSTAGRTNEIMAFDLKTGKTKWKSDAGAGRNITPLTMEGDTLIGYKLPTYDQGGEIVGIETAKGKQTLWYTLGSSKVEDGFVAFTLLDRALFAYGRLYLQTDLISERDAGGGKYLAAGFGVE